MTDSLVYLGIGQFWIQNVNIVKWNIIEIENHLE
jgi:hypothetical protein